MNNYKIVLTKSVTCAQIICKGFERPDNWVSTGYGAVSKNLTEHIPSIYWDKGYFHATLETECLDGNPKYELLFA